MNIPPAKPFFPEKNKRRILSEISDCLETGWLTTHKYVERFEKAFSRDASAKYAIALNSGTAALHLSLVSLGVKGEVITSTNTFAATAHAVVYSGCKPVFADIDIKTFNSDPKSIRKKITSKTGALMPVHVAGLPCEMDGIIDIANEKGVPIVEDAAHAHGAEYRKKKAGTLSDAGCFSFYPTKNMTSAEGGMIITNRKDIAEKVRILRDQGKESFYSNKIVEVGFNFRMSELHAVLGYYQLKSLGYFVKRRAKLAGFYTDELAGYVDVPDIPKYMKHSWYKYLITTKKPAEDMMKRLREKGIGTSQCYWPPLHRQPAYRKFAKGEFPNAERVLPKSFSLPIFNSMKMEEAKYAVEILKKLL